MHHGIATAIASNFLNRRRNRKECPQREANLAVFHRKTHRNHNRIVTAEKSQPISQKEPPCTVDCVNGSQTSTTNHRRETVHLGANTGATCICTEMNSLQNLANMQKMISQKYFPVFARKRIQAPHVFAQKLIPRDFFPACIGFVPGGTRTLFSLHCDVVYLLKPPEPQVILGHLK